MKRVVTLLSLLIVPAALLAAGGDVKSDLQVKYDGFAAAFPRQDLKPFQDVMAPDFVLHVGKKDQSREAVLADYKRQMSTMQNAKWVRTVVSARADRGNYVATIKSVFDADFDNGGKTTHFWNSAVSLDTWTLTPNKTWQLKESRLVRLDAKLDGKPAGHFPPPVGGQKPEKP